MTTNFRDDAGIVRLDGTLYAPGAQVGDVLTVQADGSLAPATGGGSQPLRIVRVALTPTTPDIVAGIELDVPNDGDFLISGAIGVSTAWNGDHPDLAVITDGADPLMGEYLLQCDATNGNIPFNPGFLSPATNLANPVLLCDGSGPIIVRLYESSLGGDPGGDPGSTVGEASVLLVIVEAP